MTDQEVKRIFAKCGRDMRGPNNPRYGVTMTADIKAKISDSRKKQFADGYLHPLSGRNHSEETKCKIGLSQKNRYKTQTHPFLGRKHTSDSILKMKKSHVKSARRGELHPYYRKLLPEKCRQRQREVCSLQTGNKNHNWRGGVSFEPYAPDWTNTLKESIRQRDQYICQLCGLVQDGKKHDIHHIDYNKNNNNPDNLITLCKSCHSRTNGKRDLWVKYFMGSCVCLIPKSA